MYFIAIMVMVSFMQIVSMEEHSDIWLKIIACSDAKTKNVLAKSSILLHELCSKNNCALYSQLPLNLTRRQKEYALTYCTYKNYPHGVENLLCLGAGTYYSYYGRMMTCPMRIAIYHENMPMIKLLKRYGQSEFNFLSNNINKYVLAAYMGDVELLRDYLNSINYHPVYNNESSRLFGSTLLYPAIFNGHRDVVDLLLTHQKTIHYINSGVKGKGRAIDIAFFEGHADIVERLFRIPSLRMQGREYCAKKLYDAAKKGHTACVELLLNRSENYINNFVSDGLKNINGETSKTSLCIFSAKLPPLTIAALHGHKDIVELLLQCNKIIINIPIYNHVYTIALNFTPLYAAALEGHTEVVRCLLQSSKTNPFLFMNNYTVLHIACKKGYLEIVKLLIEKYPLLLKKNTYVTKESPFQIAYHYKQYEILKFLIKKNIL